VDNIRSDHPEGTNQRLVTRILIADDTLSSRELLRSILESSGYEVAEAEDGEQVLERAILFKPHLVVLDLQMPKLNGCAAATALRKIPSFQTTPIVALTAALTDAVPEQVAEAGFTSYPVKPIGPARLRQCTASLL
jgi:two-component system chemotaxis response regulator CheY